jgi:hypothetical protein
MELALRLVVLSHQALRHFFCFGYIATNLTIFIVSHLIREYKYAQKVAKLVRPTLQLLWHIREAIAL